MILTLLNPVYASLNLWNKCLSFFLPYWRYLYLLIKNGGIYFHWNYENIKDFIQNMERVNTIFINIIFKNISTAEIKFNHVIHQTPDRFHTFLKQGMRVWTFTFSTRTTYILTLIHCTGNGQIKLLQWLPYKELVLTTKSDFRDTQTVNGT